MKMIYTTLNTIDEARKIGHTLLQLKLANCVNFFPITCIYNYQEEMTEEPEVVLIIKTKDEMYEPVRKVIKDHITYDNFIGQLNVEKINDNFSSWLNAVVN